MNKRGDLELWISGILIVGLIIFGLVSMSLEMDNQKDFCISKGGKPDGTPNEGLVDCIMKEDGKYIRYDIEEYNGWYYLVVEGMKDVTK